MKTALLSIFCFITFYASSQAPDNSFGDHGVLIDERVAGSSNSLAIQNDGKIILGGSNFILTRYNPDGTPDLEFGTEGIATNTVLVKGICNAIALQADGKVVATGSIPNGTSTNRDDAIIVRFTSSGELDSSFGVNGVVTADFEQEDNADEIILQTDGKIIITGTGVNEGGETQKPGGLFVCRYLADGSIDENFGSNGSLFIVKPVAEIKGLALDADGNIYLAHDSAFGSLSFVFIKLDSEGSLVTSFGNNGQTAIVIPGSGSGSLKDIKIQNGSIFTTGYSLYKGKGIRNLTLVKCTTDGQLDVTFGNAGIKILEIGFNWTEGNDLGITTNGDIVVAGRYAEAYPSTKFYASLYAFNSDGSIDSTFGTNGFQLNEAAGEKSLYEKLVIDPAGTYTAAGEGYSIETQTSNYMVSRYLAPSNIKNPKYVRIKKWLHRHGFTWEDKPNNNISYYAVQRSSNGSAFTEVTRIFNRNNQPQLSYEDAAPLTGDNYYRLAAVNTNGSMLYSNIITVNNNAANTVKIYPNPVRNTVQIAGLPATQQTKLSITDFNGTTKATATVNSSSYNWNIAQLKRGNYILRIESRDMETVTKKLVKE
ncbi:hypothetical protein BH10BAC2_BH10BAC2_26670 [soil metagenome]